MQFNIDELLNKFESEIWFLLDGTMEVERKNFWYSKLKQHKQLQLMYDEYLQILNSYNEEEFDITDYKLNLILEKTKNNSLTKPRLTFYKTVKKIFSTDNETNQIKIIFGGALAAMALVFVLVSTNNIDNEKPQDSLLSWNIQESSDVPNSFSNPYSVEKNQIVKRYIMQQINQDKWKSSVFTIASKINELEKEIDNNSL